LRGSYFRDPKAIPTTRGMLSVPDAKVKPPEEKKKVRQDDEHSAPIGQDSIFNPNADMAVVASVAKQSRKVSRIAASVFVLFAMTNVAMAETKWVTTAAAPGFSSTAMAMY